MLLNEDTAPVDVMDPTEMMLSRSGMAAAPRAAAAVSMAALWCWPCCSTVQSLQQPADQEVQCMYASLQSTSCTCGHIVAHHSLPGSWPGCHCSMRHCQMQQSAAGRSATHSTGRLSSSWSLLSHLDRMPACQAMSCQIGQQHVDCSTRSCLDLVMYQVHLPVICTPACLLPLTWHAEQLVAEMQCHQNC
jgi:hypothetical protein